MRFNVVQVFGFCAVDVARNIEIVVVGCNFGHTHHARIFWELDLLVEHIDDLVDVLVAQSVLVAILHKALAGIDHEDTGAARGVFLIEDDDTGRDAGAIKQVGRQADDALDIPLADDLRADLGLGIPAKEDAVRQDHRAFPRAFERADNVQQKSVVAIFPGWHAVVKTLIQIVNRVKAIAPCLIGEGRIGYDEVEGLEILILWLIAAALLKVRIGERIVLPDFGGGVVVQDHVHLSQSGGSVVHFLPVDSPSGLCFVGGFQQQRAGAAGRIVDGLALAPGFADANDLSYNTGDFRWGVELTLALAQLVSIVEVGHVDHAFEVVGLGKSGDDLVDLVADFFTAFERDHVDKAAASGDFDQRVGLTGVFVGDVFDEEKNEDIILIL